jgi:hypothetical protein
MLKVESGIAAAKQLHSPHYRLKVNPTVRKELI